MKMTKSTLLRRIYYGMLPLFVCSLLSSCDAVKKILNSSPDLITTENIKAYYLKDAEKNNTKEGKYAAYFDFSGVTLAYNDCQTKLTFDGIIQRITGNIVNYDVYSIAEGEIKQMDGNYNSSAELFVALKNTQGLIAAPIEKTLAKIVEDGQSAFLVTDFEEYRNRQIYLQAYATPYFKKWLESGRRITFFVTDYIEGQLQKHLYYVVFDDASERLLTEIKKGLEGCPVNYKVYTLSNNAFSLKTHYDGTGKGGTFHDPTKDNEDIITCSVESGREEDGTFDEFTGQNAEIYTFDASWEEIFENAENQKDEKVKFEHIFQNLTMDLSKFDSYSVGKLKVVVKDVEDDFNKYSAWQIANRFVPHKEGKEVIIPDESEEFYDEKGQLKEEYDYNASKPSIREIEGLLSFDQALFESTKNSGIAKLAVNLDKNAKANYSNISSIGKLLRVDIVIEEATPNFDTNLNQLFNWAGNNSLYMSIRNTLQDLNPANRVVYSYFIRQNNN